MTLKLAIVIQPSKKILHEAVNAANVYTRKNYQKTSRYIRYVYPENVVFRVPHVTLRASSLVKKSEIQEFLNKIKSVAQKFRPFKLILNGTCSFVNGGKINTHYWNVELNSSLKLIYKELRKTLDEKWSAPYHKSYNPHLTLIVDETDKSPLLKSKPVAMPKRICTIDKITILHKLPKTKLISYQKVYRTIKLGK